jgi:hypothetical protein
VGKRPSGAIFCSCAYLRAHEKKLSRKAKENLCFHNATTFDMSDFDIKPRWGIIKQKWWAVDNYGDKAPLMGITK